MHPRPPLRWGPNTQSPHRLLLLYLCVDRPSSLRLCPMSQPAALTAAAAPPMRAQRKLKKPIAPSSPEATQNAMASV